LRQGGCSPPRLVELSRRGRSARPWAGRRGRSISVHRGPACLQCGSSWRTHRLPLAARSGRGQSTVLGISSSNS
jgi:hypothetical protein